jgi:glutathione synthase
MAINVVFICDPASFPREDSDISRTYRATARDPRINLFHLPTAGVTGADRVVVAPIEQGELSHDAYLNLNAKACRVMPVSAFDIMFCRTEKPFPPGYLDKLGRWLGRTQFLNNPLNKKMQILPGYVDRIAPAFTPETTVAHSLETLEAFLAQHGTIVAKQPNSYGGRGVYKIWTNADDFLTDHVRYGVRRFATLSDLFFYVRGGWEAIELVRFLPRVTEGDKRVVVIDGQIYGAYLRRSKTGHWVHNVSSSDSKCYLTEIGEFERRAIAETVPYYRQQGFYTLGYDFLTNDDGRWIISEINVGNIGGVARLEQLTGDPMIDRFLSWIIAFADRPLSDADRAFVLAV